MGATTATGGGNGRSSAGRAAAKKKLNKMHARIYHQRRHAHHVLSHWCATQLTALTVEDLNVTGMTQLRTLARAVSDAAMSELGRQLSYKADWYGLDVTVADRWFPSSKTCSICQAVNDELTLADRTWTCPTCHTRHDRDHNAAVNLARWPNQQPHHPPQPVAA